MVISVQMRSAVLIFSSIPAYFMTRQASLTFDKGARSSHNEIDINFSQFAASDSIYSNF